MLAAGVHFNVGAGSSLLITGNLSETGGSRNLTLAGQGILTLAGTNSYSGYTILFGGSTLQLTGGSQNNISNSPLIRVLQGATLDVTGLANSTLVLGSGSVAQTLTTSSGGAGGGNSNVAGSVTVNGGLANGSGNAPTGSAIFVYTGGNLTITGDLTLQNSSVSNFVLLSPNGSGNPLAAFVNVMGTAGLTVQGNHTVNFTGNATPGTYELFAFTSGTPLSTQFSIGTHNAAVKYVLSVIPNAEVDLVISPAPVSAAWNYNGDGNFSDGSKWNPTVAPSGAGLTATFGNGVSNAVNITPSATVQIDGAHVVGSLVFNNTNGTGYILGNDAVNGHGITLDNNGNGAAVTVAASALQTIASNLTLADNVAFSINGGSSLSITGNLNETGGSRILTMTGSGTLTLAGTNTYGGGTTINSGTLKTTAAGALGSGALTINAAAGNTTLNLGANQTVSHVTTNGTGGTSAVISVGSGATLVSAGALTAIGKLTVSGPGTTEIDGAPTLNATTAITVTNTTLRFAATSGTATVASGVTVTVGAGATLELAGSVAALSSGTNRVNVGTLASSNGILVSGTHQQVGNIDGTGNTQVNAGSDLTANHIIQAALIISGASGNLGRVTISASDASGNPLGQASAAPGSLLVADSLTSHSPFGDGMNSNSSFDGLSGSNAGTAGDSADGSNAGSARSAVPEPSTITLIALAGLFVCFARTLNRKDSNQADLDCHKDYFRSPNKPIRAM